MGSDFNSTSFNDQMRGNRSVLLGKASARVARLALGFGIGRDPTWGGETRAKMHLAKHTMITVIAV